MDYSIKVEITNNSKIIFDIQLRCYLIKDMMYNPNFLTIVNYIKSRRTENDQKHIIITANAF